MITEKNEWKVLTIDISWNVNVNLMKENVIHIRSGIMINVHVSINNIIDVKKIIFGKVKHYKS